MRYSLGMLTTVAFIASTSISYSQDETIRVALFGFAANNSFTVAAYNGLQAAAAETGNVEVQLFDSAFDAQRQFNQMQDATATGRFQGFLVLPNGYSSIGPAVEEALAAGIKVGSLHYPVGPDATITDRFQIEGMTHFTGYNVRSVGTRIGEAAIAACGDIKPCKVAALVGSRAAAQDLPKLKALTDIISATPDVELVSTFDTMWSREGGLKAAQDLILAHPDVDVIAGIGGDQAMAGAEVGLTGAGAAVGAEDGIKIIGDGATITAINAVREGRWYGTYVSLPYDQGYIGGKNIIAAIRGEPFEAIVDLEALSPVGAVATKETLDQAPDFTSKWDG